MSDTVSQKRKHFCVERPNWNKKKKNEMHIDLCNHFDKNKINETPTILFQLSKREWKRYQKNSIHVTNLINVCESNNTKNRLIYYNEVEIGSNIKSTNNCKIKTTELFTDHTKTTQMTVEDIQISRLPRRILLITTNISEIKKINTNYEIVNSNGSNDSTNRHSVSTESGIIVLCFAQLHQKPSYVYSPWTDQLQHSLKNSKPNIINSSNNHFDSRGYIASFGNKGLFGKSSDSSSIGQYVCKKVNNPDSQIRINKSAICHELLCAYQVVHAMNSLKKSFPHISSIVSPILTSANHLQRKQGNVNFMSTFTSKIGLWQTSININATTGLFHTEKDVTYTLISVPESNSNVKSNKLKERAKTYFLFKVNSNLTLSLALSSNLSFIFSGSALTHRQFCVDIHKDDKDFSKVRPFYNTSSYGNERIYRHLRESLDRVDRNKTRKGI